MDANRLPQEKTLSRSVQDLSYKVSPFHICGWVVPRCHFLGSMPKKRLSSARLPPWCRAPSSKPRSRSRPPALTHSTTADIASGVILVRHGLPTTRPDNLCKSEDKKIRSSSMAQMLNCRSSGGLESANAKTVLALDSLSGCP
jgi:hypothetical protein